jgi:hypothetical protein
MEQSYKHEIASLKTILLVAEDDKNAISSIEAESANFNTEMSASLKSLSETYKFLCSQHNVKPEKLKLTPEEEKMSKLIPTKKAKGMVAQMDVEMDSGLPESHDVHKYAHAAWELANFIDGKRTILEIAHAVLAECGGPMPEKSAEFFYGLEKNGVIELITRSPH